MSPDEVNKNAIYPTRESWGFPANIQVPSFKATGEETQHRGQNSYDNLYDPNPYAVDPHCNYFDNMRRDSAMIAPKEEGCYYDDGTQNPADSLASLADTHKAPLPASYYTLFDNLPYGSRSATTSGEGWAPNPASHLLGREVGAEDGLDEFQDDNLAAQSNAGPVRRHDRTIADLLGEAQRILQEDLLHSDQLGNPDLPSSTSSGPIRGHDRLGCRWTVDEIDRFEEGIRRYGKQWVKVAEYVGGDRSLKAVKKFAKTTNGDAILKSWEQDSKLLIVSDLVKIVKEVMVKKD